MASFDPIPQARVVRKAGLLVAPPPAPRSHTPSAFGDHMRAMLGVAIGLWPLTGVVLLMLGLLWMAGMSGAP